MDVDTQTDQTTQPGSLRDLMFIAMMDAVISPQTYQNAFSALAGKPDDEPQGLNKWLGENLTQFRDSVQSAFAGNSETSAPQIATPAIEDVQTGSIDNQASVGFDFGQAIEGIQNGILDFVREIAPENTPFGKQTNRPGVVPR